MKCTFHEVCGGGILRSCPCKEEAVQCWITEKGLVRVCRNHIESLLHWNRSDYKGTRFSSRLSPDEEMIYLLHEE